MDLIYLDSAATTNVSPEVLVAMMPYLTEQYGNPSSHYSLGRNAKKALEQAREIVAEAINARPSEIIFTSGGSEANNTVIKGAIPTNRGSIVTSRIEHHSILNSCAALDHVQTVYAKNDINGIITPESVEKAISEDTTLCSIMTINNEIGTIEPIKDIANVCKKHNVLFHTDAVQAFGHIPIDVQDLNVDFLSASGHKIHAPKGVGFLYMREQIRKPLINGGQQEHGFRASTENIASIVGLGKAVEIALREMKNNNARNLELCSYLVGLISNISGCHINNNLDVTDHRHISVRVDGIPAENMMQMLDTIGICVSSGSACNSDSGEPSHVLRAIGLTEDQANNSIRVSLGESLTRQQIQIFMSALKTCIRLYKGGTLQ